MCGHISRSPPHSLTLSSMLDWVFDLFRPHWWEQTVEPPLASPSDPASLSYAASRVLLMKQPDAPYLNDYWDYPTRSAHMPEIIYSDKLNHIPLFSSKDQMVSSTQCPGKLFFTRATHPDYISVDPDGSVLTKPLSQSMQVVSRVDPPEHWKCATDMLPVNFRIGGSGPGGPEMSHKLANGAYTSHTYQAIGPHYIGKVISTGGMCIEPNSMDMRSTTPTVIYAPDVERDGIIKTS
jgi:hypothetical protein